jgi:hypothetical protein
MQLSVRCTELLQRGRKNGRARGGIRRRAAVDVVRSTARSLRITLTLAGPSTAQRSASSVAILL